MGHLHPAAAEAGYRAAVGSSRRCTRNGCGQPAVATLTYRYADSTAVVGPLVARRDPHAYDLCGAHAARLTAPRGWQLVRVAGDGAADPGPEDDLTALAEAVRERPPEAPPRRRPSPTPGSGRPRRAGPPRPHRPGHLRPLPPS